MPSIKRSAIAATGDALNGLKFKVHGGPTLVTLAASAEATGGRLSYSVGSEKQLCVDAEPNIIVQDDAVDAQKDIILSREPAPPGEHFLEITALGTTMNFLLIIEEL